SAFTTHPIEYVASDFNMIIYEVICRCMYRRVIRTISNIEISGRDYLAKVSIIFRSPDDLPQFIDLETFLSGNSPNVVSNDFIIYSFRESIGIFERYLKPILLSFLFGNINDVLL